MNKLLLTAASVLLAAPSAWAQCNVLATATIGTQTLAVVSTAPNPMSIVWHPTRNLYYCVFGGSSSYSIEVFNAAGTRLTTVAPLGFDSRGAWWNPITSQLEAGTYQNAAIIAKPLDASGYPVASTVTTIFSPGNGLAEQNVGAFDPVNNELVYYYNGSIKRVSRATNATLATTAVTGLPVASSNLNPNVVLYTGCAGKEYALFDATNRALYFVSRASMAYAGVSRLPATAPASPTFGISYAHDQLYLFNYTTRSWSTYSVLGTVTAAQAPVAAPRLELVPNPAREQVRVVGATGPLRLLDLTGRVVREQATGEVVPTSGLAAGFYVVQTAAGTARLQIE